MTIRALQQGSIGGLQAPLVPFQTGLVPAQTSTGGIDINSITNLMMTMMVMVMMMKMMGGMTESVA